MGKNNGVLQLAPLNGWIKPPMLKHTQTLLLSPWTDGNQNLQDAANSPPGRRRRLSIHLR